MKWAAFTRLQHHGSLSLTPKQPYKCRPAKMLIRFHHLTTHKHQSAANNSVADSKIHFPNSSHSVWSLCERRNYPPVSQALVFRPDQKWPNLFVLLLIFRIISETIPSRTASTSLQKSTHLLCPQRIESVVQGLTTGGKCYHCNPHDRSCWCCCPPPPSRSGWWGTDLGFLWKYEAGFKVATATHCRSQLVVN